MPTTALQDQLATAGAPMGDYRGAYTVANFGDVSREFTALRSGFAVFDMSWRSKLLITGEDRLRWLNGMVTNNVRDLAVGSGVYAFLLNAQGRIQADMYCYNRSACLMVDTDASQSPNLRQILDKYIIMDDVEVTDAAETFTTIGVGGPQAAAILRQAGMFSELQPLQPQDAVWSSVGLSIVRSDLASPTFEIWLAPHNAATLWVALVAAGATPAGFEAVELMRIWSGRPRFGQDIRERDLPQETGQERALNYNKGCYVGQEIVERIHSRGAVHRMFTGFLVDGRPPQPGTKVSVDSKDVGEVTSSGRIPLFEGQRAVALGYLRREAGTAGSMVQIGETAAVISSLPFEKLGNEI
jgi:folate-binding protein YgfZ